MNKEKTYKVYSEKNRYYYKKIGVCPKCGLTFKECGCDEEYVESVWGWDKSFDRQHEPMEELHKTPFEIRKDIVMVCIRECSGFELGVEYLCVAIDEKTFKIMDKFGTFVFMDKSFFKVKE